MLFLEVVELVGKGSGELHTLLEEFPGRVLFVLYLLGRQSQVVEVGQDEDLTGGAG